MSNTGLKLREPVIGDAFDRETYGRPTGRQNVGRKNDAPRTPRSSGAARVRRAKAAPVYDSGRTRIDEDGVRTVKISGQATPARRRTHSIYERPMARYDQHPDRAAQWALFLGVFMVIVAIVTGT